MPGRSQSSAQLVEFGDWQVRVAVSQISEVAVQSASVEQGVPLERLRTQRGVALALPGAGHSASLPPGHSGEQNSPVNPLTVTEVSVARQPSAGSP